MKIVFKKIGIKQLLMVMVLMMGGQMMSQKGNVYIDDKGVMRFENDQSEVQGFGVNYTVPFAHAYRSAKRMGIDPKMAIDEDVYHFKRLGFDLFRVHVWDTQISDVQGHLLENEYLDAFDYLIAKLKEHGFNYVITPIAYWGNGWPEPDTESPGFSHFYGKDNCLTNPEAIKAQANYLFEFLKHRNPYTDLSFIQDPNTLAFEVSNEPHHRGEAKQVKNFVKKMIKAMRKTGTDKPIFYNMSHGVHFAQDYFDGGAQGGTFQWYPTGLGYQSELPGNILPNVNDYDIPFDDVIRKNGGAKLVYEFDAADVGGSYVYPALARSFRTAGIQIATHFSYDPTFLAPYNTEYNTHYMNLIYTPQKALALKISSEIFHEVGMYEDFGTYPENTSFGNTFVDYKSDLALYDSGDKYFYTNSTSITPKSAESLNHIAGFGQSPVVDYSGQGAYFLDQIEPGVWRLEVLPDAAWVENPFGRNSSNQVIGTVQHNVQTMTLNIDDLGLNFSLIDLNGDGNFNQIEGGYFDISPGVYVLRSDGKGFDLNDAGLFNSYPINTFYAPQSNITKDYFNHNVPTQGRIGESVLIKVQYVSAKPPKNISIQGYNNGQTVSELLTRTGVYEYEMRLNTNEFTKGYFNYHLIVTHNDASVVTYPEERKSLPSSWDFYQSKPYQIPLFEKEDMMVVFEATDDATKIIKSWRKGVRVSPKETGGSEFVVELDALGLVDNENLNGKIYQDYTFKHSILPYLSDVKETLLDKHTLVLEGRSLIGTTYPIQVALVMDNGSAFGAMITLEPNEVAVDVSLNGLKPVKTVSLPRPYPSFLPYYFEHHNKDHFDISRVEFIQISLGPGQTKDQIDGAHGIAVSKIYLK